MQFRGLRDPLRSPLFFIRRERVRNYAPRVADGVFVNVRVGKSTISTLTAVQADSVVDEVICYGDTLTFV